jgi:hypothetical protein
MARQKGIIKLEGSIADYSFYKTGDGYFAREKGGVSASRIANDPAFKRTRENGAEFGRATKAGKLFRTAFRAVSNTTRDRRMINRLTQVMMLVIQADATSQRGERNVIDGEAELLERFEFNINSKLDTSFFAPYTATINRVTGNMEVVIDPFNAANLIAAPSGSTHYKFLSAGVAIDFENGQYEVTIANSMEQVVDAAVTAPLTLTTSVAAANTHPLFLAFGIDYYQQVNGVMYALNNGAFNSLAIVKVDGA